MLPLCVCAPLFVDRQTGKCTLALAKGNRLVKPEVGLEEKMNRLFLAERRLGS
jgi:hypothetical protein